MMIWSKPLLGLFAATVAVIAVYVYDLLSDLGTIASGYVSHTLCTNVIMLGRAQGDVERHDLSYDQNRITESTVFNDRVETTASIGPVSRTTSSIYRPGLGCSNVAGWSIDDARAVGLDGPVTSAPVTPTPVQGQSPQITNSIQGLDRAGFDKAIHDSFVETSDDVYARKNTRAVLVHYRGQLIAERYGEGFTADTALRGMSMTKSVSATLIGILAGQGKLDIHASAPVRGWADLEDARSRVTTHQLLTMTAGFDYTEEMESDPRNLLSTMLYAVPDAPGLAAQTPLRGEPGDEWEYQTVHSVLLQEVLRNVLADDQAYFRFAHEYLFQPLGMRNSFFQADANGTFIGGASMYACGRDWLKLGLLYLNHGVHEGQRILPEGWVEYATTASAPSMQRRAYGAQIWLNDFSPKRLFPRLPEDAYAFQGHYGQYVVVIPSMELVVVRLGMTFNGEQGFDKQNFLQGIVDALPAVAPS